MANAMANPGFLSDWRAQDGLGACLACHAPFQDQQAVVVRGVWTVIPWLILDTEPHPGFDPAFQAEGVTCMACHRADNGQVAVARSVDAPHGTSVVDGLGEVCVRCHQMVTSPLDLLPRPIIDTANEHRSWKQETGRTESCADCHMGEGGHTFHGGALRGLAVELVPADAGWRIEVENLAGHNLPTGETSGALDLWVERDGRSSRLARFTRVIVGPPWREQSDTTLKPGERRSWSVDGGDVSIRVVARAERLVHLPAARQAAIDAGESVQQTVVLAEVDP